MLITILSSCFREIENTIKTEYFAYFLKLNFQFSFMFVGTFGWVCAYVLCNPSTCRAQKSTFDFKEMRLKICCVDPNVRWETTLDYRTQTADPFSNEAIVAKPSCTVKVLENIRNLMNGRDLMNANNIVYYSIHFLCRSSNEYLMTHLYSTSRRCCLSLNIYHDST